MTADSLMEVEVGIAVDMMIGVALYGCGEVWWTWRWVEMVLPVVWSAIDGSEYKTKLERSWNEERNSWDISFAGSTS